LQKSTKELTAAGLAFTVLLLAYAQLGFLVTTCGPRLTLQGAWLSPVLAAVLVGRLGQGLCRWPARSLGLPLYKMG